MEIDHNYEKDEFTIKGLTVDKPISAEKIKDLYDLIGISLKNRRAVRAMKCSEKIHNPPEAGDWIYIPSGDDELGGLAQIKKVYGGISAGAPCRMATLVEFPGVEINLDYYLQRQARWKKTYGAVMAERGR
jgi:hypothetical protein